VSEQDSDGEAEQKREVTRDVKRKPPKQVVSRDIRSTSGLDIETPQPLPGIRTTNAVTAYRDGIHQEILLRRKRRDKAKKKIAERMESDSDYEADPELIEPSGDSIFEMSIEIWIAGLPMSKIASDVKGVLERLRIVYVEVDKGNFECWYTPAGQPSSAAKKKTGNGPRTLAMIGYVHFEVIFSKRRKNMFMLSETMFKFKKLEGIIEDYEDLVEGLVATFEGNWYSQEDYPR
jgi:hypothetical protein